MKRLLLCSASLTAFAVLLPGVADAVDPARKTDTQTTQDARSRDRAIPAQDRTPANAQPATTSYPNPQDTQRQAPRIVIPQTAPQPTSVPTEYRSRTEQSGPYRDPFVTPVIRETTPAQGDTGPRGPQEISFQDRIAPAVGPQLPVPTEVESPKKRSRWRLGVLSRDTETGVRVIRVVPDSAAAAAGLEGDDLIVTVGGYQVGLVHGNQYDLGQEFNRHATADGWVNLLVQDHRNGELVTLPVQLESRLSEVQGSIVWRDRQTLPPEAVVSVELREVTRPGAPVVTLARTTLANARRTPVDFAIEYDPAEINPARTYVVHATIATDERTLYTTSRAYEVLTAGAPKTVDLYVERVQRPDDLRDNREAQIEQLVKWFREYLQRDPDALELSIYQYDLQSGKPPQEVQAELLGTTEFYNQCERDRVQYVSRMYEMIGDRRPTDAEVDYWLSRLDHHRGLRTSFAKEFLSAVQ